MSRTHVSILGVQIPLRTLASVTSTPVVYATIGSYEDRYSYSSPDIAEAIKAYETEERKALECLFDPNPPFEKIAARTDTRLPVHTGVNRQLFTYSV